MAETRDDPEIFWVDPRKRGIFPLDRFHISKSLAKTLRRDAYQVTLNTGFEAVIEACADRDETWINGKIFDLYSQLHDMGYAHSIEVWDGSDLIGGVYGVTVGGAYCGESMFSRKRDASKIALAWLVDHLNRCGFSLFDTQFLTPHLASLGAIEISRAKYHDLLDSALELEADYTACGLPASGQEVVQRNGQTS